MLEYEATWESTTNTFFFVELHASLGVFTTHTEGTAFTTFQKSFGKFQK